jgi:hypothetical protein
MKNKNNDKTPSQLLNLITEVREAHNGGKYDQFAHSYATGVFISIIDSARDGWCDLQEGINNSYDRHSKELQTIRDREMKNIQKVCNESKPEELYA